MDILIAAALGTVQGLTEFLPVSSSGHLVLFQHLFGLTEPELFFDICVHAGTLVAICMVFYREIFSIFSVLFRLPRLTREEGGLGAVFGRHPSFRMAVLIVAGSVPTGLLGLFFHDMADRIFGSLLLVGLMLVCTGTLLWLTRRCATAGRPLERMGIKDALVIGFVQGLAILPGISRSGATISAALLLGVDRETAGRYSFLLSVPAIVGATVLGVASGLPEKSGASVSALVLGFLAATLVGYFALRILLRIIKHGRFSAFSPYCWTVGVFALVYAWAA